MNDNSKVDTKQHQATPMTKEDASRIQASQAKAGHDTGKGSFAASAQAAGDKHQAKSK